MRVAADELAQSDMTERNGFLQNPTSECCDNRTCASWHSRAKWVSIKPNKRESRKNKLSWRERLLASWPSVSNLLSLTQCGDLLAMRLPRRVFYTSRNDKVLRQEPRASSFASDESRATRFAGKCFFAIKRFVCDFCIGKNHLSP